MATVFFLGPFYFFTTFVGKDDRSRYQIFASNTVPVDWTGLDWDERDEEGRKIKKKREDKERKSLVIRLYGNYILICGDRAYPKRCWLCWLSQPPREPARLKADIFQALRLEQGRGSGYDVGNKQSRPRFNWSFLVFFTLAEHGARRLSF